MIEPVAILKLVGELFGEIGLPSTFRCSQQFEVAAEQRTARERADDLEHLHGVFLVPNEKTKRAQRLERADRILADIVGVEGGSGGAAHGSSFTGSIGN